MQARDLANTEQIHPLRRSQYDRLVDAGEFEGARVELLWGLIVAMSPQGAEHSWVIEVLTEHFVTALLGRARVRVQLPFAASDVSEPEPDLALVPRSDERRQRQADHAWLVVEVARTSQTIDRKKTALYAAAGVPETWVVDVVAGTVEVYTEPGPDGYARVAVVGRGGTVVPTVFPDAGIAVDAILP